MDLLTNKNILIFGATSYIASHLRPALVNSKVKLISRRPLAGYVASSLSVENITNLITLDSPDIIMNFIGQYDVNLTETENYNVNMIPLVNLIQSLRNWKGLVFNAGSYWENGCALNPGAPLNQYASLKKEQALRLSDSGLNSIHFQLCDNYGPLDLRNKLFTQIYAASLDRTPLSLSPGEQRISPLHISDVVSGILHAIREALSESDLRFRTFGIAGETYSLKEIVGAFENLFPHLEVNWGERPYSPNQIMWPKYIAPPKLWRQRLSLGEGIRQVFI